MQGFVTVFIGIGVLILFGLLLFVAVMIKRFYGAKDRTGKEKKKRK